MGGWTGAALALCGWLLGAPEAVDPGADYAIVRWTIDDGLPQSSVTGIAQSKDGYLWLSTFGGVVRFDGVRFELFDRATQPRIGGHRFVGVAEDDAEAIWLGIQDRGLTRGRGPSFESVQIPGDPQGAVAGPVRDGRGTLWAAVGTTLVRIRDEAISVSPIREDLYEAGLTLQVDDAGALWLTSPKGVACWEGPCERPHELIQPTSEWLTAVARTPTGGFWHTRWGEIEGSPIPRPIGELWAHTIWWNGRTWWSAGAELASVGPGGRLTRLDLRALPAWESNAPAMVYSYLIDREGALWVGTGGGGLYQVKSRDLTRYSRSRGLPGVSAWELVEDRAGRIWVNSRDFLSVIEAGHGHDADPAIAALLPLDALAVDPTGALWLASAKLGLHRFAEGRLSPLEQAELGTKRVQLIQFDPSGVPWLGVEGLGLLRLPSSGRPHLRWSEGQLGGSPTVVAFAPGGVVWVGTSGGLARIVGDEAERVGVDDGMTPGAVRSLLMTPGGALWVGTYGAGMARIKDRVVQRITHAQGLCENVASHIIDDGHGFLWINGNRGVSRLRLADLEAVADHQRATVQCALYDSGEGNGPGGLLASDGKLWFPTINGAVSIDPATPRSSVVPLAKVESAELDGAALGPGARAPPGRGDLVVHSTALSFLSPRAIQFRYRLVGFDDAWADPSSSRVARYAKLPPGEYRFEVEARSVDGVWSDPASLSFTLSPHFYQTGWFAGLSLSAVLLGLWGASTARTRSIRARNRALQQEIERRERVEAALREEEAHYRTVFERSSEGLFVYELDGRLVDANAAAQALLGKDLADLLHEEPLSWVAPESRTEVRALIAELAAGTAAGRSEIHLCGPGGQPIEVRMAGARLDLARPQVLLSAVDLTPLRQAERERRELEHQLQQSQKLEALGLLAGGIAHDFNNLLTAMGGQAALVRGADLEDREHLDGIQAGVKRAAALTKKLLVFGRKSINSPKVIVVEAQLDDLVSMLERTMPEGVQLELRHLTRGLKTRVDPVRLEQMLINLVVNSRDAIHGHGRIRITSELANVDAPEAQRHAAKPGAYVMIAVADDGMGIDQAIRERIFEPFFTTKEVGKGTGLGLSIVHGAVREAGGFVTVESERGKGATFRLYLPVAEAPPLTQTADLSSKAQATSTVLVCDDEPAVQRVMARALRAAGYRVLDAAGPEEAEALVLTATDPIDLLITDVVMPQMSGPELARRVRASLGDVPVLFVSGHTRDLLEERGLEGRAEFLPKPFTVAALVERVAALVARSEPPRAAGK